jgi:glutathione-regulated potassium-efflux system protein KefB
MGHLTLTALGLGEEQARAVVALFREHDEQLLRDQHLVYDDDVALRQTTREAYVELEQLFAADTRTAEAVDSADAAADGTRPDGTA